MVKYRIRNRLLLLFIFQIVLVLLYAGFYLQWHLRNVLEKEVSEKLQAIAVTIASQMETDLVFQLEPGDENTRNYTNLRSTLLQLQSATGMKRLFIFDKNLNSLVDTENNIQIGTKLLHLKADKVELLRVFAGQTTSSVLFNGADGQPYKTAYAPLFLDGQIKGAILFLRRETIRNPENIR
jgi:hypothetical protein